MLTADLARGPTGPEVGNLTFRSAASTPGTSHLMAVLDPGRLGEPTAMAERAAGLVRDLAPLDVAQPVHPEVLTVLDALGSSVGVHRGEAVGA